MNRIKFTLIASMVAALCGCASFPENYDKLPANDAVSSDMEKKWASLPAVRYVAAQTGTSVRKRSPLPLHVAATPLNFTLNAKTTLGQFISALELQKIRVVLKASSEKSDARMVLTNFTGSVGEFIDQLAITHDLDYEFMDGVILLREGIRYMVTMPQNPELLERIPAAMTALGASNVKVDVDSGLVTYEAPATVRRDVDMYLERMAANSSMVALQIAVIDLRLNRDAGSGFDWNEFTAKWGTGLDNTNATTPTGSTGTTKPTTPTTPIISTGRALGSVMSLSGGGFGLRIDEAKFSLVAAIKLLSKYGKAQTNQDVLVSTLSGAPVKISSGTQIPYVSGVGAVAAAGGAVSGSVNTATVNSGLKIDIIPRYDASEHLVVTNVKAKLSSLVRFRELSAGNTVGTISQPEIQELEFENISRMRPGEIILLGGISYDQVSESYTSLAGLEKSKLGSEAVTTNRHAIFIVIRPSITIFGQDRASVGGNHAGL